MDDKQVDQLSDSNWQNMKHVADDHDLARYTQYITKVLGADGALLVAVRRDADNPDRIECDVSMDMDVGEILGLIDHLIKMVNKVLEENGEDPIYTNPH